jgi:hypothetical protein
MTVVKWENVQNIFTFNRQIKIKYFLRTRSVYFLLRKILN